MYSSEDLVRFYFQHQTEVMFKVISVEQFCSRNKVLYNIFYKWYKDTRNKLVEIKVDGLILVSRKAEGGKAFTRTIIDGSKDFFRSYTRGVARDQWSSYNPEECKLSVAEGSDREVGELMLSVTRINRFYYLREFTDMCCKHSHVLSVIREQLHR